MPSSAADDTGNLSVCYEAMMQLFVEWRVIREMHRENGHPVIALDPEQFPTLTPANQALVLDCKTMIEGIDDNDPLSWPERPEDEPVLPEVVTTEGEI
jgi:hypothetical protein